MTYEQKMEAMNALNGSAMIAMREPGNWYCSLRGVEIGNGSLLSSECGNGTCPKSAVENLWTILTELKDDEYIVLNAMIREHRQHLRWNGFMWKPHNG